ncbi:MAG: hypothetical protein U0165_06810 [Polyangiaceae bacterium]
MVVGKTLGGATLAMGQALFVALAPLAGFAFAQISWGLLLLTLLLASIARLLGFRSPGVSTQRARGYHAVMSIVLIPLWILSGSMFPGPPTGLMATLLKLNPMSHTASLIRRAFYGGSLPQGLEITGATPSIEMTVLMAMLVGCLLLATLVSRSRRRAS